MDKNVDTLMSVSKLFTEETLKNTLIEATGCKNVEITGWNLEKKADQGDSYLSTVTRMMIKGIADGEEQNIQVFVKSLPENLGRRKTYRSTDFFYNEIMFYTQVMPKFKQFLKEKNQSHLLLVPECYAHVLDGKNDFIVLEDVSVRGFTPAARQNILSIDEFKVILRGMARFHGVSFAYKSQHEAEFYKAANQLTETYYSDEHWDWYKTFHSVIINIAKDAMAKEYGGTPEEEKFSKISDREFQKKSIEVCGRRNTPTSVINQGDAWAPNFLTRTIESTGDKEALLLDFQLARCAGPVSDISFFLYVCTDASIRDAHFDNLLKYYHDELSNTISALGSDSNSVYPWKLFLKEVQQEFVHGLNFSFEAIPLSMLEDTELFDLDAIKGDNAIDIAEIWKLKPIENKEKRKRLADVVMHAMKRGFL